MTVIKATRDRRAVNPDRMPPVSLDAEKAFLGSLLFDPKQAEKHSGRLRADQFHNDAHQKIQTVILDLISRQSPVDAVIVASELVCRGWFEEIGGDTYLRQIIESVPHAENAPYYARLVQESWARRRFVEWCQDAINAAHDPTVSVDELAEQFGQGFLTNSDLADQHIVPTAISDLMTEHPRLADPLIKGLLRCGETCNIIAPSKAGKSWLSYGLALSIVTGSRWMGLYECRKGRVLIIDNELHRATIAKRIPTVAEAMHIQADQYCGDLDVVCLRGQLHTLVELEGLVESMGDKYVAVILDAWYRMIPPNVSENDNAAMAQLYNRVDQYALKTGAAWLLIHHPSKGGQAEKRITDVGAGAGSQSRAADTHLILREHVEPGCVVVDAAVRSFPPVKPFVLRWEYPLWIPENAMDPAAMKGRLTLSEQRQMERDRCGTEQVLSALANGPLTVRAIRESTGMSKDRCERLLDILESKGRVTWEHTVKGHNKSREYRVVDDPGRVVGEVTDRGADGRGGRSIKRPTDHPPTVVGDHPKQSTTVPEHARDTDGTDPELLG